jgi:hypothetical protein
LLSLQGKGKESGMRDRFQKETERSTTGRGTPSSFGDYYEDENEADYEDDDDGDDHVIGSPREARVRRSGVDWYSGW